MAIAFVQYAEKKGGTGATSIALDSGLSVSSGNLIVVCVGYWDNSNYPSQVTGISDTEGNTYTKVNSNVNTTPSQNPSSEIWYAKNISSNASNVVTATFDNAVNYPYISVSEFSGADTSNPLDDENSATGQSTSFSSGNMTASTSDSLIIGNVGTHGFGTISVGSGFTALDTRTSYDAAEYKIVSSTGTYDVNFTDPNTLYYSCCGAIFKGSPGATNVTVTPSAQAMNLTIQSPTINVVANTTVTPSAQALTLTLLAPTITNATNVTISPTTQALTLALQSPTVSTIWNTLVQPSAQALSLGLQNPTIQAIQNTTISPATQQLLLTLLNPTITTEGEVVVQPEALQLLLTLLAPTIHTTSTATTTTPVINRASWFGIPRLRREILGRNTIYLNEEINKLRR